jgi:hypothetical protein
MERWLKVYGRVYIVGFVCNNMPLYIRDLNTGEFGYQWRILEPILSGFSGMMDDDIIICLSILLLVDIWVVYRWELLWKSYHKHPCVHLLVDMALFAVGCMLRNPVRGTGPFIVSRNCHHLPKWSSLLTVVFSSAIVSRHSCFSALLFLGTPCSISSF